MSIRTLIAVLHKEDDIYVAECPEVGTVSQGYSTELLNKSKGGVGIWISIHQLSEKVAGIG